ncbi:hypothetical protein J1605_005258 [Eschrichtius robustus]|uniref:Uncharacterized protein n=1 Tax=Eschrichtius robustus TaxID=9764 RepID=A0AB34HBF5_ESCRO|nr:hypothetical protein J1605_005258 [Eschrichtius robustus]
MNKISFPVPGARSLVSMATRRLRLLAPNTEPTRSWASFLCQPFKASRRERATGGFRLWRSNAAEAAREEVGSARPEVQLVIGFLLWLQSGTEEGIFVSGWV